MQKLDGNFEVTDQPRIHQSRRDLIWAAFRILAAFHLLKLGLKVEMRPKCGLGMTDESEAEVRFYLRGFLEAVEANAIQAMHIMLT